MAGFQGAFSEVDAPTLGAAAIRAALDGAGVEYCGRGSHGLRVASRPGASARAAGGIWRRSWRRGSGDNAEQDVRLGHEGGDAGF